MEFVFLAVGAIVGLCFFWMWKMKGSQPVESCVATHPEQQTESAQTDVQLESDPEQETVMEPEVDYSQSYQAKYLLTRNEWYEYKKLKKYAAEKNLQVCPKVRLLDLVEPRKGAEHYKSLFYKIQAKHVDFLICDQDLHIKAVVELDDNSHMKADRQARDKFVDQVLTSCGFKVIRTRLVTEETLNGIT